MIDREMHGHAVDGPCGSSRRHAQLPATNRRPLPPQGAVTVPRVYPSASAARVLTLERLYGTSLTDLEVSTCVRTQASKQATQ